MYGRPDVGASALARWLGSAFEAMGEVAIAQVDLKGFAALRLDDPGSVVNAYLESWTFPTLKNSIWSGVDQILSDMNAKMSIGYVPAWVDDGEKTRGTLWVEGQEVKNRTLGQVYPSWEVVYETKQHRYDLKSQAHHLQSLHRIDLELHGWTHVSPEVQRWGVADDRYENSDWYREFLGTETRPFQQRDWKVQVDLLSKGMKWFKEAFGKTPSVMIPPGHAVSWDTGELVLQEGMSAMCGRSLVLGFGSQARRSRWVKSVDISKSDVILEDTALTLESHDKDIQEKGLVWFKETLEQWQKKGIKHFVSIAELVALIQAAPQVWTRRLDESCEVQLSFPELTEALKAKLRSSLMIPLRVKWPRGYDLPKLPEGWLRLEDGLLGVPLHFSGQKVQVTLTRLEARE
jgi:hypothetical protein